MRSLVARRVGPRQIKIVEEEISCEPDKMLVKTRCAAPSIGTELKMYRNPGLGTGRVGGTGVGEIIEVGKGVRGFKEGDFIITNWISSSSVVGSAYPYGINGIVKVKNVDFEEASFLHQARVALTGVRRARIVLGDSVLVIGVGAIGMIAMQLCRLAGADQVIVADLHQKRLQIAKQLGADNVIDASRENIAERTFELTEDRGADIILDVSGSTKTITQAMKAAKHMARIILLSWIPEPIPNLMLGSDFHSKHLELISARMTMQFPGDFNHSDHWTPEASYQYLLRIMRKHKLRIKEMITHRFKLEETAKAFQLADEHPEQMLGIIIKMP